MLMVRVNIGKDKAGKMQEPIVGLLIDTHLMPMQAPPKAAINLEGALVQTPGATGFQALGVVAAGKGFIVGPLASMTPIMQPDEEGDADESPPDPERPPKPDVD
ncbi:hypothetical protein LCGC14_1077690 [marine sediment metagenome]|uniref:Uncharacterized protein n=1 Tax=marine sediment metagenome TaxID=412755 RepID=A0A0F9QM24_9ZZZZ